MGREKEIEEMANILWHIPNNYFLNSYNDCERIAECIYDDGGYRKQSEGKWIKSKSGLYVCSECDKTCPYDAQVDDISYWECKYCPNCGAKMRGGTE